MCLGIPGQVIALSEAGDEMATVRVSNVERRISMALVAPGVAAGDWVLVHAGLALSILSAEEARETLALLRELSEAFTGELSEVTPHTAWRREPPLFRRERPSWRTPSRPARSITSA